MDIEDSIVHNTVDICRSMEVSEIQEKNYERWRNFDDLERMSFDICNFHI